MDIKRFMTSLETEFQTTSGLTDRRRYKIFYSAVRPSPLLILGINPGGRPADIKSSDTHSVAPASFYATSEKHDYVDCTWDIARPMCALLAGALDCEQDSLRFIVKSNLAFRRSAGTDAFSSEHGMTLGAGMREAMPFVRKIINATSPSCIIIEGGTNAQFFLRNYCIGPTQQLSPPINVDSRGRSVNLFRADQVLLTDTDRSAAIVRLGHPSSFGHHFGPNSLAPKLKKIFRKFGISPPVPSTQ